MLDLLKTILQPNVGSAGWIIAMVVILAVALLCCFAGYRVIRVMMAAGGFALGVLIGSVLLKSLDWPGWVITVLIILIGVAVGVVSYLMFRLGLFLLAGVATFFMVGGLLGTFMKEEQLTLMIIIAAAAAILAGVLALVFTRQIIIAATSYGGGWFASKVILSGLIYTSIGGAPQWQILTVAVLLAVLGVIVQIKYTAKNCHHQLPQGKSQSGQASE